MTAPDGALAPGGTVVCVATGPSLTPDDVDACRGRAGVIAINDAYRLAPWADVLYSSDVGWWTHYRGVPSFRGRKMGIKPLKPAPEWGVTVWQNTGDSGLEVEPGGLRTGRNSGYAAINLAVQLGAARILLLGYDMSAPPGQPTHFFGEHPDRLRGSSPYGVFMSMFATVVAPLAQIGVEVINCSRRTALEVFPRMSISEALP